MSYVRRLLKYVSCICAIFTLFMWTDFSYNFWSKRSNSVKNIKGLIRSFRLNKQNELSESMKYILFWTPWEDDPLYYLAEGPNSFKKYNCSISNCYVTSNKTLVHLTKFDAIVFKGKAMNSSLVLPSERSEHQKYIFYEIESAENYPICNESFDNYFNLTMTYRLDSDITFSYILIKDINGTVVGPKRCMDWIEYKDSKNQEFIHTIKKKTKAVAWFVSNCVVPRLVFAIKLQYALKRYNLTLDIYGECGYLWCNESMECERMLKEDYFFYLALENSNAEDYVTEKILTAMQNDVVPIVLGGADYTGFLPPGSYLDARVESPKVLAADINRLMHSPDHYLIFFRWKSHYTYHNRLRENLCSLCATMHDETMMKYGVYNDIRRWWNPNYEDTCRNQKRTTYFFEKHLETKALSWKEVMNNEMMNDE